MTDPSAQNPANTRNRTASPPSASKASRWPGAIALAVRILIRRRPKERARPATKPAFYSDGFTVIESGFAASVVVAMLFLAVLQADQQLVALGLTFVTAAGLLTAPKLLANSFLRRKQAQALQALVESAPGDVAHSKISKTCLAMLVVFAVISLILEVAGTLVILSTEDASPTGVWLFASGALLLIAVLAGSAVWTMLVPLGEALTSDARSTEGEVLDADPADLAWVVALLLFLGGTMLQFADALMSG